MAITYRDGKFYINGKKLNKKHDEFTLLDFAEMFAIFSPKEFSSPEATVSIKKRKKKPPVVVIMDILTGEARKPTKQEVEKLVRVLKEIKGAKLERVELTTSRPFINDEFYGVKLHFSNRDFVNISLYKTPSSVNSSHWRDRIIRDPLLLCSIEWWTDNSPSFTYIPNGYNTCFYSTTEIAKRIKKLLKKLDVYDRVLDFVGIS